MQTRRMMVPGVNQGDQARPCRKPGSWQAGTKMVLLATFLGLFFTAQIYYSAASFHHAVSWGQAAYWAFGDWYEWALLSPVIFWLCRRFQFDRQTWLKTLPIHLVVGLFLSAVHAVLCALAALL